MISRDQARAIAKSTVLQRGLGVGAKEVLLADEITWRLPQMFAGPSLAECWVAHAERAVHGLGSSCVLLISKKTGLVLYTGSASDEG